MRPFLAIGAFTELRSAEIERLDWSEVHVADRFIEVKAAEAKTASRRIVPMPENLVKWRGPYAPVCAEGGSGDAVPECEQATRVARGGYDRGPQSRREEGRHKLGEDQRRGLEEERVTAAVPRITRCARAFLIVGSLVVEIEAAFRDLKGDLQIRPVFHQKEDRIEAHIFVAFLSYCLHVTLRHKLRALAPGLTPRAALEKFTRMQMMDVHFPTTDGRKLVFRRYTKPEPDQAMLLEQLKLQLPPQAPPQITSTGTLLSPLSPPS